MDTDDSHRATVFSIRVPDQSTCFARHRAALERAPAWRIVFRPVIPQRQGANILLTACLYAAKSPRFPRFSKANEPGKSYSYVSAEREGKEIDVIRMVKSAVPMRNGKTFEARNWTIGEDEARLAAISGHRHANERNATISRDGQR